MGFLAANMEECENPYKDLHTQFRNNSTRKPPNTHQSVDVFQRAFKLGLLKAKPQRHQNLSRFETLGIQELSQNPDIVAKKADKGSTIVVINSSD